MRHKINSIDIGMPQLGPYGLSENWLLRHLGDAHWSIICKALDRRSRDIVDEDGNRLYASFARARWTSTKPLSGYRESDRLEGSMEMVCFGDGVFLSSTELGDGIDMITVQLASIFTRREAADSNDRLLASLPPIPETGLIPSVETAPSFLTEHRLLRSNKLPSLTFMGERFDLPSEFAEYGTYKTNGYLDFNGANLLYFASYPTISDICESQTRYVKNCFGFDAFVTRASPMGRDIFYFGNANLGDSIQCTFRWGAATSSVITTRPELFRSADKICISKQFVVRERP
jgi:probable biosynthetic protein (TIGR04098 family)